METTFVLLTPEDAAELHALQTAAYAHVHVHEDEEHHMPVLTQTVKAVTVELTDPERMAVGLRSSDGALVAAVRGYVGGPTAIIGRLCVHPDHQGHGLAMTLLTEFENHIPAHVRAVKIFTGEDTATSHHFYAKLGYTLAGHEDMESGVAIVELRKTVAKTAS